MDSALQVSELGRTVSQVVVKQKFELRVDATMLVLRTGA